MGRVGQNENQVATTRGKQRRTKLRRRLGTCEAQRKVTEVSADHRVLDALVKEKNITWTKSGRENATREAELFDK